MESSVNRRTLSGQDGQLVRSCRVARGPSLALAHDLEGWEGKGRKALTTIPSTRLLSCGALRETLSSEPPRDTAFLGENNSPHFT